MHSRANSPNTTVGPSIASSTSPMDGERYASAGPGSAHRRRLALRRDAGHRVLAALGLVLALGRRVGHAERLLLGLVGRKAGGRLRGARRAVLGHGAGATRAPGRARAPDPRVGGSDSPNTLAAHGSGHHLPHGLRP